VDDNGEPLAVYHGTKYCNDKGEKGALIVAKRNGQDLIAYVKLEPSEDGTFYFVKSATLARKEYLEGKELLWKAAPQPSAASTTSTLTH